MNNPNIFNLISEQVFVEKFDELIKVLSKGSSDGLELIQDPNNPGHYFIAQNGVDVTEQIAALLLTDEIIDEIKAAVNQTWGTF